MKPVGRFLFAFMGSIVPVGMILLASGVTARLDRGSLLLGPTFWGGLVVAGVGWIVAVLAITDTEHKRLYRYAIAGFQPPAFGCTTLY